ncbi:MAG: hypothetical protein KGO85_02450 [Proteobacteria bacterium]|nr:hypothetical protein [Pseudomonadota bacterium]
MVSVLGIESPAQYWQEVVLPNALHYRQHPTAREAFNLAASLWHLIDWIFEDPRLNPQRQQKSDLQATLRQQCPALGVMHDITTPYKYARMTKPQGNVTATDVEMLGATFYFGPGGPVSEHPAEYVVTLEGGEQRPLNELFDEALKFWDSYFRADAAGQQVTL